jgi:hypothetical protein
VGNHRQIVVMPFFDYQTARQHRPSNAFRHFVDRSLAPASLDHAYRDHRLDFSATLTGTAFGRSSLRWLGISTAE